MKNALKKFSAVPSFRKVMIGGAGAVTALAATGSYADDMATAATAAITAAQTSGTSVGAAVVACVAALCVVGVIIALVRKV